MTIIVECHYTHLLKLQLLLLVFCKTAFMPLKSPFHSVSFQSHVCQLRNRKNAEASTLTILHVRFNTESSSSCCLYYKWEKCTTSKDTHTHLFTKNVCGNFTTNKYSSIPLRKVILFFTRTTH